MRAVSAVNNVRTFPANSAKESFDVRSRCGAGSIFENERIQSNILRGTMFSERTAGAYVRVRVRMNGLKRAEK